MTRLNNTERNKDIVKHYKKSHSLAITGQHFNLTRQRIHQIVGEGDNSA